MTKHECNLECPRCEGMLALTTEWGYDGQDTCTAVLCCPDCRTESGWSEDAVEICHASTEEEALAGIDSDELLDRIREGMETEAANETAE